MVHHSIYEDKSSSVFGILGSHGGEVKKLPQAVHDAPLVKGTATKVSRLQHYRNVG
jgi:hypothetical protein